MEQHAVTGQMLDRLTDLLKFLIPQYVTEGKSYLTIGIGCTGGRHRSVMIAEALKKTSTPCRVRVCACSTGTLAISDHVGSRLQAPASGHVQSTRSDPAKPGAEAFRGTR